ncbi:MAG: GNAT family N-acetyltransferase [Dehalococcoidia bacterium]
MDEPRTPVRTAKHETDVLLKDGSTVHLRPIKPEDVDALVAGFTRLSPRSVYLRFHHMVSRFGPEEAREYTDVDYTNTYALVATLGEAVDEKIIAVARYVRLEDRKRAGIAFVVEDSHQGRGIATQLLESLAVVARENGIETFEGDVLAENRAMMSVFRDSGFPLETKFEFGTYHVAFPIEPTAEAERRAEERERIAEVASIATFFRPRSVAVIGASRRRGKIGAEIFNNIVEHGYKGIVYPVNPSAETVRGVKAYASIADVPGEVELAIIVVPAEKVLEVAEQCARKGVKGAVVISAGFRETGEDGAERERALLAKARSYGMRLVGPNCMGVLNTDPEVSLNATFSPQFPPRGNVALASHSGALGLALLDYAGKLNLGLSTFASVGNRADVSSNDLIQYWAEDEGTDVILLYLESFGNPRKFGRLARQITARKPIVAVKSGRTAAGSRAAASHTGALATADVAAEALFRQAGVIRTDTLEQLFDVAGLLSHQPPPAGSRVAILTNSGGPAILAADTCESNGLEVPPLPEDTVSALRAFLPPTAALTNPVDMLAAATAEDYARALRILLSDGTTDAVIVIFTPPLVTQPRPVAEAIHRAAREQGRRKPLLACFMTAQGAPAELSGGETTVPSFAFPEGAAMALAKMSEYTAWLKRPQGALPVLDRLDRETGRAVIARALAAAGGQPAWLSPGDCNELLAAFGIRSARAEFATTAQAAVEAAKRVGFPAAVKLASSTITHKSDIGGVHLDLKSQKGVREAFRAIESRLAALDRRAEMEGVIVQQMVPDGVEVIIGVTQDPAFGPLMMFGLGGTFVELLQDLAFRIQPLTDVDAREMVRSVKAYPLLEGWRGADPGDIAAIEEMLLRVSALVEAVPEIREMDLNPVKALAPGHGCVVVDARVLVQTA